MKSRIIIALLALACSTDAYSTEYSLLGPPLANTAERSTIATSDLPLDRPWEQFSAEDRARLRGQYQTLAANEEPPFPQEGMKPIVDKLRVVQKKLGIEGDMFAVITVDEQGNARSVSYLMTPELGDMGVITSILSGAKYKPAKCANVPCAMEFPLYIHFKLIPSLVF